MTIDAWPRSRGVHELIEFGRELIADGGLRCALGWQLVATARSLFAPDWTDELSEPERVEYGRQLGIARESLNYVQFRPDLVGVVAFLELEDRYSEGEGPNWSMQTLERLIDAASTTDCDRFVVTMLARMSDQYPPRLGQQSLPADSKILCRLIDTFALLAPELVPLEAEIVAWQKLIVCAPGQRGWIATGEWAKSLVSRLLFLLAWFGQSEHSKNAGLAQEYSYLAEMTLLASDSLVSLRLQFETSQFWTAVRQDPSWDYLVASPSGDEIETIAALLAEESSADTRDPSVELVRELIAADCARPAIYAVLGWFANRNEMEWPNHSSVVCLSLAHKSAISTG